MIAGALLDRGGARVLGGETLWPVLGEPHRYAALPSGLVVPPRPDDLSLPDLVVTLVRGRDAGRPPEPHGVLDLRLQVRPLGAAALEALALVDPRAAVSPAPLLRGQLRFELLGQSGLDPETAAALSAPVALVSNGLDAARVVRYLSPAAASFLSAALGEGATALAAHAELVVPAVAARVPRTVTFPAAELHEALRTVADPAGVLTRDAVVQLWAGEVMVRPGAAPFDAATAEILTDWTLAATAEPAPAQRLPVTPTYQLHDPTLSGVVSWNLEELRTSTHVAVVDLDLADAVRRAVAQGAGGNFRREVEVDPLDVGLVEITVDHNLPRRLEGVALAGVQLVTPAAPPARVDRLSDSRLLDHQPPEPVRWRLSPGETLRFDVSAFAVLSAPPASRRDGPARSETSPRVLVGVDDLPVELVTVSADHDLLAEAVVHVSLVPADGAGARLPFDLTAERPLAAAPVTAGDHLRVSATSVDGSGAVAQAANRAATSAVLTSADFPGYGRHEVQVSVDFDVVVPLVAVELQPGDRSEATVLSFTPTLTERTWSYHHSSIFGGGFRSRSSAGGLPSGPFTSHEPGDRLRVAASELTTPGGSMPDTFEAEGMLCVRGADAQTWQVLPRSAGIARDPDGRAVLNVLATGDGGGFLQLETRLLADDAAYERLRTALAQACHVDRAVLRLQPAAVDVQQAVLLVAAGGTPTQVATNPTSGFPPYTAVFSVALDANSLPAALAASAGQAGHVFVRYELRTLDSRFLVLSHPFIPLVDVGVAVGAFSS